MKIRFVKNMLSLSHKNLKVYQISLDFVTEVYELSKSFPKEELFSLSRQVRRAAVSVCSNIAEGAARKSKADKRRFYEVARSSVVEVDTQFEISINLKYVQKSQLVKLEAYLESLFRILSKMINNLDS